MVTDKELAISYWCEAAIGFGVLLLLVAIDLAILTGASL